MEYGNYSMVTGQRLLEWRCLLEGGAYFNIDTKKCYAYLRPGAYWRKNGRYFNGTIISTSFAPLFPVCSVIFSLNLNEILLFSAGKLIILLVPPKAG